MLFLDGVYVDQKGSGQCFVPVMQHQEADIEKLTHIISKRLAGYLERSGLIERDMENSYLTLDGFNDSEMTDHQGCSISYRISVGPQKGKRVFSLRMLPPNLEEAGRKGALLGRADGFSLHAGVCSKANERGKLERLCRYITRPPLSTQRLTETSEGKISYELKTPYRDGTTHMLFEPLDFIAKLAALVPVPR